MDYSTAVERHFRAPCNVGPLSSSDQRVFRGEACSPDRDAWVVIEADIRQGYLRRVAFQALGCPHLIAACSRGTELLAGAAAASLASFDPQVLSAELGIPPQKLGSLLIFQDALRNCFRDWDTTPPAGAQPVPTGQVAI